MHSTIRTRFPAAPPFAQAYIEDAGCAAVDAFVTTAMVVAVAAPKHDTEVGRLSEPAAAGALFGWPRRLLRLHAPAILGARIRCGRHKVVTGGVVDAMVTGNAVGKER